MADEVARDRSEQHPLEPAVATRTEDQKVDPFGTRLLQLRCRRPVEPLLFETCLRGDRLERLGENPLGVDRVGEVFPGEREGDRRFDDDQNLEAPRRTEQIDGASQCDLAVGRAEVADGDRVKTVVGGVRVARRRDEDIRVRAVQDADFATLP